MKEKPIIFSSEMVRAILDDRKTQTRRILNPQPTASYCGPWFPGEESYPYNRPGIQQSDEPEMIFCPYGKPGDRLWVRETFVLENDFEYVTDHTPPTDRPIKTKFDEYDEIHYHLIPRYRATEPDFELMGDGGEPCQPWRPSIHMPRWASRITLEVTDVRVERVQDIRTLTDIPAEGIDCAGMSAMQMRGTFHRLWDSINAKRGYPWSDEDLPDNLKTGKGRVMYGNPWVWVVKFKRIES